MKLPLKQLLLLSVILYATFIFTACSCKHEHFNEATCTEPSVCVDCGEVLEDALGHTWVEATCIEPKTCSVCGETEGEALGHTWIDATMQSPKTCEVCGATEGNPLSPSNEATAEVKEAYEEAVEYAETHSSADYDYAYNTIREIAVELNSAAYINDQKSFDYAKVKLFGWISSDYSNREVQLMVQEMFDYVLPSDEDILSALMRKFQTISAVKGTITETEVNIYVDDMDAFCEAFPCKNQVLGHILSVLECYNNSWLSDEGRTPIVVFKDNGFTFSWKAVGSYKLKLN